MAEHNNIYSSNGEIETYLDMQAEVGISKHMGGYAATDELYRLCHLEKAREVLEVGCGIGIGPTYIARQFDCKVVAVDLSEKMLSWASKRAQKLGLAERIEFQQADVMKLPFEDNRFDAVVVESVLAFVHDKKAAIDELLRVTKPGGYIGLNETYWLQQAPEGYSYDEQIGEKILSRLQWDEIWNEAAFSERAIHPYPLSAKQETKDRIDWIGWPSILAAWGRLLVQLITRSSMRRTLKAIPLQSLDYTNALGYALFIGRKA